MGPETLEQLATIVPGGDYDVRLLLRGLVDAELFFEIGGEFGGRSSRASPGSRDDRWG